MVITTFEHEQITPSNYWLLTQVVSCTEPDKVVIQEYKDSMITWDSRFSSLESARNYFQCLRDNNFAKQDALAAFKAKYPPQD